MFMFKIAVVGEDWTRVEEVVASSLVEATEKLHNLMWWDCITRNEYLINFVGKSKLS